MIKVDGTTVRLLTDTQPGRVVNQDKAWDSIIASLEQLDTTPVNAVLINDMPQADPNLAGSAVIDAQKMIARPILLAYEDLQFYISREKIGAWITSNYQGAQLMAGLDGVQNKIHPGDPIDKDLYHLPPEEAAKVPHVCASLEEAIEHLKKDHAFLTKGGVFDEDFLEAYIALKMEEVTRFRMTTHPVEFDMYYSS